jgi:hypothetical protein
MERMSLRSWLNSLTNQELHDRYELYGWDLAELREAYVDDDSDTVPVGEAIAYFTAMRHAISEVIEYRDRIARDTGINRNRRTVQSMGRDRWNAIKVAMPITTYLHWEGVAIPPQREGRRVKISCPLGLHEDSTPSFTIYPNDKGWYCFGCNQGGTVIDLVLLDQKLNDPRLALEYLEALIRETTSSLMTVRR